MKKIILQGNISHSCCLRRFLENYCNECGELYYVLPCGIVQEYTDGMLNFLSNIRTTIKG